MADMTTHTEIETVTRRDQPIASLADLAGKINSEHRAAYGAAREALEHAAECGRLLLQAKTHVKHGDWLRWLGAHTEVGARQCQKYMRLAESWEQIEAKCDSDSHLSIESALKLVGTVAEKPAAPPPRFDLSEPFTDSDFEDYPEFPFWLQWKLSHVMGLPKPIRAAISAGDDYGIAALAMCGADDIRAALAITAAYVKEEKSPTIATTALSPLVVWADLKMTAQRIIVLLWGEVESREKKSDSQNLARANAAYEKLIPAVARQ